ncbi:MAG TPA: beta-phosphoglucomutase family hydrolase, partial [Actinomycetota bacterium]|nr:beta-phosphoglucomutase family hydrolase [Actinomycetota bacterium]
MTGLPMLDLNRIHAVIFDMDGVVTDTASVHAAAWKRLFDEYLTERSRRTGEPFRPFDVDEDYRRCVDGKPRYDGVRSFLASREISLPEGDPSDPPERETVCGLGNRKNGYFLAHLKEQGADAYSSTVTLVRDLQARGVRAAVISASRNMAEVLASAGLSDLFGAKVDGVDAEELGLSGKPDPAIFLEAARRLGVEPARAAVVEDALAGVEAGRRGRFGLVIG